MTPHKQNSATPHMSDKSDNISDKSLPDPDRQALRADIIDRYETTWQLWENTWQLWSLDANKRAAALSDLAALDGETI